VSVNIPKLAIVLGSVTPPQGDIIEARVHLGGTNEVSSWDLLLQNWDKKYSPSGTYPIIVGTDGHIDIGRGVNVPQIITTRIESIKYESGPTENYLRVSGRCWGEKLFRYIVTKTYLNQKGEAIVKDLIDYFAGLSHVRDSTELIEDTDTTYTKLEYENTPAWDILKFIAGTADLAGVIGYDFRVAPDAKFEFFPRLSKTCSISLTDKIELTEYRKEVFGVRNKITIKGVALTTLPRSKDRWTEPTADPPPHWTAISSNTTISRASADPTPEVGTYCVKVTRPAALPDTVEVEADITDEDGNAVTMSIIGGKNQRFKLRYYSSKALALYVKLLAPDASNYFETKISWYNGGAGWETKEIPVSAENEADYWNKIGAPDWRRVAKMRFWLAEPIGNEVKCAFDELHFTVIRFENRQEDAGSIGYPRELVEIDEELYSDNECMLRAKAILAQLKDPAEYITLKSTVIDYGTTPLLPGDKIHVTLPNENVDADFRILTVEYYVDAKTQTLEITLELGREVPLLADYLYALRSKSDHMSRHKIARLT
jgi:hypothetical protein